MSANTAPSVAPAHKSARRKEARPGELLAAALDLFVEKGYAATRVEEVARRAGVSKGTLFLYFASKEDLFKAVVRENLSLRFPQWSLVLDQFPGTSAELLRYAMGQWWSMVGDTKASGISKLMMSEASNFPELAAFYQHEVIEPGNALIRRILQRGIERGEFRAMDLQYGVHTVLAPLLYLIVWKHSFGACTPQGSPLVPEDYLAAQVDILLNGLRMPDTETPHRPATPSP
ncbi:MAG: TetR/AcrR family transcriptional regulator [Rhodoferax sp.]|nr:TetR/AcrR family transcriptional regulator [Rhodoferax sp.]